MEYLLHIAVLVGIYSILAISLDLVVGHTGMLSIAHASFYGLGAYASALLATRYGVPFVPGIVIAAAVAALMSVLLSIACLRLRSDLFVVVTLGFQMVFASTVNNWVGFTRGPFGIAGIPVPSVSGFSVGSPLSFAILTGVFALSAYLIVLRITSSPFGRVLHAIREDEAFADALGKNSSRFKMTAFGISGALAGLAGTLYAHYITFIDPTCFTLMESILVLSMVVIGGAGSVCGPVVGAAILVVLPEALRFIGLPNAFAANVRQILYGSLLVAMMMARSRGLMGRYTFNR